MIDLGIDPESDLAILLRNLNKLKYKFQADSSDFSHIDLAIIVIENQHTSLNEMYEREKYLMQRINDLEEFEDY